MAELGYDERGTNFFTTNATLFATSGTGSADPLIGGLEVTVTGTGAPVLVEFYCPAMGHSSHAIVSSYFVTNGAVTHATSNYKNWATAQGSGGSMFRRMVLTAGTDYTFKVGLAGGAAGTSAAYGQATSGGSSAGVMFLRVSD